MKKKISVLLTMLLLVTAVLSGCGEGGTESKKLDLVGDWKASVDCTPLMASELEDLEEMIGPLSDLKFIIDIDISFKDDKTFVMNLNEDSFKSAVDNLFDSHLKDALFDVLEQQIKDTGLDMSVEELLALSGMDIDTLLEEAKSEALTGLDGLNPINEGIYTVKDGKLYLGSGFEEDADSIPEEYASAFTYEKGVLTLSAPESIDEDEAFLFPMELTKVK